MGHYTGTTIAFSHKGGFWKTRYSYAPTCYSTVDNVMITNNSTYTPEGQAEGQVDHFWEHNINNQRNRFYDRDSASTIRVISNQDPSSVKLFKAISLESSTGSFSAGFTSNAEQEVGNVVNNPDFQLGATVNNFTLKEGIQYAEIPRSRNPSSSHLDFVCIINEVIDSDDDIYETTANYSELPIIPLLPTRYGWNADTVTLPNTSIPSGYQTVAIFVDTNDIPYYLSFNSSLDEWELSVFQSDLAFGMTWNEVVYIHSYNPDNTITFASAATDSDGNYPPVITDELGIQSSPFDELFSGDNWSNIRLFSATEPKINGDPMRGKFLAADLTIGGGESFELHAINIDYEPTKLDGSKSSQKKPKKSKATSK